MHCREFENSMMGFMNGNLPDEQAAACRVHLESCSQCREAYAEEVEMTAAFREDSSQVAGKDFVRSVMLRIDEKLEERPSIEAAFFRFQFWKVSAAAALGLPRRSIWPFIAGSNSLYCLKLPAAHTTAVITCRVPSTINPIRYPQNQV